jgi:hypothetical protein
MNAYLWPRVGLSPGLRKHRGAVPSMESLWPRATSFCVLHPIHEKSKRTSTGSMLARPGEAGQQS